MIPIPRPVCKKVSFRYERSNGGMPPSSLVSRLKTRLWLLLVPEAHSKLVHDYSLDGKQSTTEDGTAIEKALSEVSRGGRVGERRGLLVIATEAGLKGVSESCA